MNKEQTLDGSSSFIKKTVIPMLRNIGVSYVRIVEDVFDKTSKIFFDADKDQQKEIKKRLIKKEIVDSEE